MNNYKFDNDIQLLSELPKIREITTVESYLPDMVATTSTTLCVDIDISSITLMTKDLQDNYQVVNKGLQRYHTLYIPDQELWLPIVLDSFEFWLMASRKDKQLLTLLQENV